MTATTNPTPSIFPANPKASTLVLNEDQQAVYKAITQFIMDPAQHEFVLSGYAGVGKSALVGHLINEFENIKNLMRMINAKANPMADMELLLTASNNAAASNLATMTKGMDVRTVHSAMGQILVPNKVTGKWELTNKYDRREEWQNKLVIVDEAGTLDDEQSCLYS